MKKMFFVFLLVALNMCAYSQQATATYETDPSCPNLSLKKTLSDWSDLSRYQSDNATLGPPTREESRVIFFGSSTTDNWGRKFDSVFFPGKPYINRGISGETSSQMLLRFQQDVVDLKPAAVVFLGGTNDVAGNSGAMSLEMTENNIRAMTAMAEASGIKMILASQLPVIAFPWNKCVYPKSNLLALTAWEKDFAKVKHLGFVDYYSVLVGADGNFRPGLSVDGVHPNKKAYEMMAPLVEAVIHEATNSH
jgi:lysophospholipase L1-like esterase